MNRRAAARAALLLSLLLALALLAGGCGRKAKPEPLFGRGITSNHYETR